MVSESVDTELSVLRFQKIFGLYSVEHHGEMVRSGGSVDSGRHELSENVWSKASYRR